MVTPSLAIAIPIAAPVAAAVLAIFVQPYRRWVGRFCAALSVASFVSAVWLCIIVVRGGPVSADVDTFRADSQSMVFCLCVTFVASLAALLGPPVYWREGYTGPQLRRLCVFGNLFAASMTVAVLINNVAIMWVAIEATTIASALLIPVHLSKASVEASWKYLLLCTVGIGLAFAGTVLSYFDLVQLLGPVPSALNWTTLVSAAPLLHPEVLRLAFIFLVVGYGTKAGMAPMHTWLPDAHSEAPSSISAMMSGVLLAVSTYAVMRWKAVVDASALGVHFTDRLMMGFGVLSLGIAAFSLLVQRTYKRMLAYSSVEHSGIIWIGLGLGPIGVFAALLHVVNHAVAKSMLFLLSGRILHRYETTDIARTSGLLKAMPATGFLFAAGTFALVGMPPFGLFVSELWTLAAGFGAHRPGLMLVVLALLAVAFVGVVRSLNLMLYGDIPGHVAVGEVPTLHLWPLALCVMILIVLGFGVPTPFKTLLTQAAGTP
jgi:hydrogenase-4 component F